MSIVFLENTCGPKHDDNTVLDDYFSVEVSLSMQLKRYTILRIEFAHHFVTCRCVSGVTNACRTAQGGDPTDKGPTHGTKRRGNSLASLLLWATNHPRSGAVRTCRCGSGAGPSARTFVSGPRGRIRAGESPEPASLVPALMKRHS